MHFVFSKMSIANIKISELHSIEKNAFIWCEIEAIFFVFYVCLRNNNISLKLIEMRLFISYSICIDRILHKITTVWTLKKNYITNIYSRIGDIYYKKKILNNSMYCTYTKQQQQKWYLLNDFCSFQFHLRFEINSIFLRLFSICL